MESAREAQTQSIPLQRAKRRWNEIQEYGPVTRTQESYLQHYEVHEDHIFRKEGDQRKLVVPLNYVERIIAYFHDEDHPGAKETIRRTKKKFYCRGMEKKIYRYVKNCLTCAQIKSQQRQEPAPMRTYTPERPFQTISMDILGPYIKTPRENKYILAVEDVFSKWTEMKAYPEVNTKTIIKYLEEEIIPRYGPPQTIISDQGRPFLSNLFLKWCRDRNIITRCSAIHHQRANPIERRVQEMKKLLRLYTKEGQPERWDEQLHKVMLALRKRRNAATTMTPSEIILGYELPEYGEWALTAMGMNPTPLTPREDIIAEANRRQLEYKRSYAPDDAQPAVILHPGQLVFVRAKERKADTFFCPWKGPYPITKRLSTEVYEINKAGLLSEIHLDDIRPTPRVQAREEEEDRIDFIPPEDTDQPEVDAEGEPENQPHPVNTSETEHRPILDQEPPDDERPQIGGEEEADAPTQTPTEVELCPAGPSWRNPDLTIARTERRDLPRRPRRRVRMFVRDTPPPRDV